MAFDIEDPLVFALCGLGEDRPGWSRELFDALDDAVALFKYSEIEAELEEQQKSSVRELLDFHEIGYSHVAQNLMTNWEQNASDVLSRATSLPEQAQIEQGLGWLKQNAAASDSRGWPHLLGVFFWTTSSYVRAMIKNEVAAVLSSRVAERRKVSRGRRVHTSFLAHGFGAAIARDTLDDMYAGAWGEERWSPEYFQFDSYHAIASACELLDGESCERYATYVRPAPSGESAVLRLYDYRHSADPLTAARASMPADWPEDLYERISIRHFRDANVHRLSHYVQHPSVHIPILRSWFGYYCISPDEARAARESFPDVTIDRGTLVAGLIEEAAQQAQRELTRSPTVVEWLNAVALFRSLVERIQGPSNDAGRRDA